jgi:hypothetical protein
VRRWGLAWIGLTAALAVHVADEALGGFLGFYNPVAQSIRDRVGLPFPPSFGAAEWLGGLIVAVAVLLVFSTWAFRGRAWMRPLSYGYGALMVANGLVHIVASAASGQVIPGTFSSPLLFAAALYLIHAAARAVPADRSAQAT